MRVIMRSNVSLRRRVVGGLEAVVAFLLVGLAVSKVLHALEGSGWQSAAGIGAAVAVAGSVFLLDRVCVRWLDRRARHR